LLDSLDFCFQGKNVAYRLTATVALGLQRGISYDCSHTEQLGDNINDIENEGVQAALSEVDSCNDYALDSGAVVFPSSVNTEAEKENDVQIFWSNDRTCW